VNGGEPPRGAVPPASGALGRCPACGGPLYGWIEAPAADARRAETYVLDRCERCGLGIVREGELDPGSVIAGGRRAAGAEIAIAAANRRSLQAALGEGRWAALSLPERGYVLTPLALESLAERAGYRIEHLRFPVAGRNVVWMWQTLMNAVTLHPNFAREALAGRLRPSGRRGLAAFLLDSVVSVVAAPLVAILALPVEAIAALGRRGGLIVAVVAPIAQSSSSTSSPSSRAASS
jgi:hypothetical protein